MVDRNDDCDRPDTLSVGAAAPLHMAQLLLIDGEDGTRFRIAADLQRAGASVDLAGDGEQALCRLSDAQACQEPYDLVLIDLAGLGPKGLKAAAMLRDAEYAGPVLALTDKPPRRDGRRCVQAGCDELIRKADDPSLLIEVSTSLVNREKTRRFGLARPDDVTSELSTYPELLMMLRRFVGNLPDTIESVLAAQRQRDIEELRSTLDELKRSATRHGYLSIRASAVSAQQQLEQTRKPEAQPVMDAIGELVELCQRATASPADPPPPSGPPLPPSG